MQSTDWIQRALRQTGWTGGCEIAHDQYRRELRAAVVCSMQTAIALDTVGEALKGRGQKAMRDWCCGTRGEVPPNPNVMMNGKGSVNSLVMVLAYDVLTYARACYAEDLSSFNALFTDRVTLHLEQFKTDKARLRKLRDLSEPDTMVALSICLALAYYTALKTSDENMYLDFSDACLEGFGFDREARLTAVSAGLMVHTLLHDGYFCSNALAKLEAYGIVPDCLIDAFRLLRENALDYVFVRDEYDGGLVAQDAPYSAKVLAEVSYYMTRVSTQYSPPKLDGKPRAQLVHAMCSRFSQPYDIGFVFGAVCTSSEHRSALVMKELREGSVLWDVRMLVDTLVGEVN